jgi:glycosyltransferase involved in cell wall biosynthesis
MKLLYLLPEYVEDAGGGIIAFYRHLLPALARQGHEVRVIVGSGLATEHHRDEHEVHGVRVERLDHSLFDKQYTALGRFASQPMLRQLVAGAWAAYEQAGRGADADVVETVDWGLMFLPWYVQQAPHVVVQMHGSTGQIGAHDPQAGSEIEEMFAQLLERSALHAPLHLQAYSGVNARSWRAQGVDVPVVMPPAWRSMSTATGSVERHDRALVVGRVQRWNGPHVLCEALAMLGDTAPGVDWIGRDTAAGADGRSFAASLAASYPGIWGGKVRHVQQVPAAEVAKQQRLASFVVVPSEWDTFNFTCVEAMAAGAPVICSTGAGASQTIEDGRTGLLFESGNAAGLADAMRRMLALTPAQRRDMGEAARLSIQEKLDPQANAAARMREYERIASQAQHRAPLADSDWLAAAVRPGSTSADSYEFLHRVPLRAVLRHAWERTLAKAGLQR